MAIIYCYVTKQPKMWLKTATIYLVDNSVGQLGGSYGLSQFSWSLPGLQNQLQLA